MEPFTGICPVGACIERAGSDAKVEAFVESLRREHERSALATDDVVALNNRGYNYGPPPRVELDEILTEVRGQR